MNRTEPRAPRPDCASQQPRHTTGKARRGRKKHQADDKTRADRAEPAQRQPSIFEVMRAVRTDAAGLSMTERVVLLHILDLTGNGKRACRWSVQDIAKQLGVSYMHACETISGLEAKGFLESVRCGESKFAYKAMFITEKVFDLARDRGKMPRKFQRLDGATVAFAKAAMTAVSVNPSGSEMADAPRATVPGASGKLHLEPQFQVPGTIVPAYQLLTSRECVSHNTLSRRTRLVVRSDVRSL
jgi:DNA-binding MarR family transcriptional regulator